MGIYRMTRYSLISSFANRITGGVLSVGLLAVLGSDAAKLVYAAVIAAFSYHLLAGVRHLIWDTGRGMERAQSQRSAWLIIAAALVLTLVVLFWALRARGGA
jgi:succinate dehydrogenase / fumarate reductase cytochrome b subunit